MSHFIYLPSGSETLPPVGSAAFDDLIVRSTAKSKKRQPTVDKPVPADVQQERNLADSFLSEHNRILKHLEQSTKR